MIINLGQLSFNNDVTVQNNKKKTNMSNKLIHSTGEYITWDNAFAYICIIKDAYCVRILNYCICQCKTGYIWNDGKCLEGKISFFLTT